MKILIFIKSKYFDLIVVLPVAASVLSIKSCQAKGSSSSTQSTFTELGQQFMQQYNVTAI